MCSTDYHGIQTILPIGANKESSDVPSTTHRAQSIAIKPLALRSGIYRHSSHHLLHSLESGLHVLETNFQSSDSLVDIFLLLVRTC